jgi:phosphate:Na+ symporter
LLLVAVGFALSFLGRRNGLSQYGIMLMGLGMLFLGMSVMGDAMAPLREDKTFLDFMRRLDAPWFGILLGAVFTVLIQSSAATSGIVIMMAASGLIGLPGAIAVTLGANVGTCGTALLAAIGKPREAVRAAVVHLLFNLLGVLGWGGLVVELAWLVEHLGGGIERQIANAHLVFNLANTAVLIWFTEPLARIALRLVPDRPRPEEETVRPKYLDPALLATPSLALRAARLELARLGAKVRVMLVAILPETLSGTPEGLERVAGMDTPVDELHVMTIEYLRNLGAGKLTEKESRELMDLMDVANAFENMGDIIETDLVTLGRRRIEERVEVSESTRAVIAEVHAAVVQSLDLAIDAVARDDAMTAHKVVAMKPLVNHLAEKAMRRGAHRLIGTEPRKLQAYTREMEMIEKLKRLYYFAKRAAKVVAVEAESLDAPPAAPEAENG